MWGVPHEAERPRELPSKLAKCGFGAPRRTSAGARRGHGRGQKSFWGLDYYKPARSRPVWSLGRPCAARHRAGVPLSDPTDLLWSILAKKPNVCRHHTCSTMLNRGLVCSNPSFNASTVKLMAAWINFLVPPVNI